jgi:hypothetical protein
VALGALLYANLVSGSRSDHVLLVVAIHSEVLFQSLIYTFSLTVAFGMISRGEMQCHVECLPKGPKEV